MDMVNLDHVARCANGAFGRCVTVRARRTFSVMTTNETFQIPIEAAEVYEAKFVPSIFAEWAPHILEAAGVSPGDDVLDVACGTGIVARTAAGIIGSEGSVIGVDLNDAMLAVARRLRPDMNWRQGTVDDLPFPDDAFDAAVCQMALMFFADRRRALREMTRVTRSSGRIAVVVPAALDQQPAYRVFVDIAARHAGEDARALLSTYWNCGHLDELVGTMEQTGLTVVDRRSRTGTARFDSAEDFVATEVEGSPLAERIDEATYSEIRREVATEMGDYVTDAAGFEIPLVCHVVAAEVA